MNLPALRPEPRVGNPRAGDSRARDSHVGNPRVGARRSGIHLGAGALALLILLTGCDRSPKGPGSWEATLESVAGTGAGAGGGAGSSTAVGVPGVAFLAVTGEGIEGFETDPGGFVFARAVPGEPYHRVVVVAPEGGEPLRFRIRVRERRSGAPSATPVELFDRQNARIGVQDTWRVRIQP